MAKREVKRSGKARDGDITRLCGDDFAAVEKAQAIRHIEDRIHRYVVNVRGASEVEILVKNGRSGKYLTTSPDGGSRNNLEDLPDC